MKKPAEFLITVARTFNPFSYSKLSESVKKDAIRYFLAIIFFGTVLMSILYVPNILSCYNNYDTFFEDIKVLRADFRLETNRSINITLPARIFLGAQKITIDTTGEIEANETEVLITEDFVYYENGEKRKKIEEFTNITEHKDKTKNTLMTLFIMLSPALFVITYLVYLLLFSAIILLASFVMMIITNLLKLQDDINFNQISNIALFASSFLALSMVLKPVMPGLRVLMYGLFIGYVILGTIFSLEPKKKKQ